MPAGPAPLMSRDSGHPCVLPHTSSSAAFRGVLLLLLRPLPPLCSRFPVSDLRVHHGPICPPQTTSPPLPRPVAPQLSPLRLQFPRVSSGRPGPAHCQGIRVQLVILATHLHFSRWNLAAHLRGEGTTSAGRLHLQRGPCPLHGHLTANREPRGQRACRGPDMCHPGAANGDGL